MKVEDFHPQGLTIGELGRVYAIRVWGYRDADEDHLPLPILGDRGTFSRKKQVRRSKIMRK